MKVMFCISCLSYGGAEKNLRIVANGMAENGHDIVICNFNTLPTVQKFDERIKIVDMPDFSQRGIKRLQQLKYMVKLCKEEKPDLIVSFLFMPNFLSVFTGKLTNTPVIISERADPTQHKSKVEKFIYYFYRFADGAVFQTNGAKECFPKMLQKKSTVIANPVIIKDASLKANYESPAKSIAYSARFEVKQKRQDIMLEAFKLVLEKHPEYTLDFFGDGPDEQWMKDYAAELKIENNVVFHGVSSNVLRDISNSEMFVLSSDYEGIPNSLLEAMTIGLPCVSTDCSPGGARMLIESGKNGLIVPCADPKALSDAINSMIEDRDFAIACGTKAQEVKERFELGKILTAWEDYCIKIAGAK